MICPQCGTEYRDGFARCGDCEVELIPKAAPAPEGDERAGIELVKIYEGGNPALLALLESLFDDAGIEYSTTSEGLQDLFGWGRLGVAYNFAIGPVMFYVRREDEAAAQAIVAKLSEATPPDEVP